MDQPPDAATSEPNFPSRSHLGPAHDQWPPPSPRNGCTRRWEARSRLAEGGGGSFENRSQSAGWETNMLRRIRVDYRPLFFVLISHKRVQFVCKVFREIQRFNETLDIDEILFSSGIRHP